MQLTYTNQDGAAVTLRQVKPLFLTKLDGVGRVRQSISTFRAPEQDGAFYISSSLDMRNITIEGTILADTIDSAYEYRSQLLRIFTPKLRGTLVYRGRQIACIVEEAAFSSTSIQRAPTFFISLLCPSPFFEPLESNRVELASWDRNFLFPLEIVQPGIEMEIRQPSQIVTIQNEGDVPCGCVIEFRSLGSVQNPELRNLDTGEFIRINTEMTAGQEIFIYTHFAGKRIVSVIGTTQTNIFNLMDIGSTFLQLSVGKNVLRYDASEQLDLLEVIIHYRPQFLGVYFKRLSALVFMKLILKITNYRFNWKKHRYLDSTNI